MGNVYLAGETTSTTGIATFGAHQTTYGGSRDAFLVKFNSSGVRQWGTYYGGEANDFGHSTVTDTKGNVYLAACYEQFKKITVQETMKGLNTQNKQKTKSEN